MHHLIEKAYKEMYPTREMVQDGSIRYSRAFSGYNANVKYSRSSLDFSLSYKWRDVSEDITLGLLQSLMNKVFRTKVETLNIELYSTFLRKLTDYVPVTESDDTLEDSFNRVNDTYFSGMMLKPNLVWGGENVRTLGTYQYSTDTIMISRILLKDLNLLDYVMYHEMLHKKLKFTESGGRTTHHSREFRLMERKYLDADAERKLKDFVRRHRRAGWF